MEVFKQELGEFKRHFATEPLNRSLWPLARIGQHGGDESPVARFKPWATAMPVFLCVGRAPPERQLAALGLRGGNLGPRRCRVPRRCFSHHLAHILPVRV